MNKHVSMKKKVLSFFLAFVILFSSMPAELFTFAFANGDDTGASTPAVRVELTTDPQSSADEQKEIAADNTDVKLKINVALADNVESAEVAITLSKDEATLIDESDLKDGLSLAKDGESDYKLSFTATEDKTYEIPLQYPDAEPAENETLEDITLKITESDVSVTFEEKESETPPDPGTEGTEEQPEPGGSDDGETGQETPGNPSEETTPGTGDATQPPSATDGGTEQLPPTSDDGNSDGNTPTTTPTTPETDGASTDQNPVDDVVDTVVESMSVQAANAAEDDAKIDADVNLLFKAPAQQTEGSGDDEKNPEDEDSQDSEPVDLTISNTLDTLTITDGTLSALSFNATAKVNPEKITDQTELTFDFDIQLPTGITADEATKATLGADADEATIEDTYNEENNTLTLTITQPLKASDDDVTPAARSGEENSWSYDITVTGLKVSDDFTGGDITIKAGGSSDATTIQIAKEETPVNENAFYNLSVSAAPTALTLNAEGKLDNFTITAKAEKIADKDIPEGTNEFSFTLSIDLPQGISLQAEATYNEGNNTITAGDTQIAAITLPDGATIEGTPTVEAGKLNFTIKQPTTTLTDDAAPTYSVAFSGSALTVDADTLTETAEITATATPSGAQGNAGSTAITVSNQAEEQGEAAISYTLQLSKDAESFAPVERKLPAFVVDASATMTNPENYKEETFTFNIVLQLPEGTTLPKEKTSVKDMTVYADGFLFNNTTIFEMTGDSGATIGDVTYEAASGTLTIPITQPVNPTDSEETEPETKTGDNINERSWNYNLAFQADVFTLADNVGASTLSAYISIEDNATVSGTESSLAIAAETAQLPENTEITERTTPTQTVLWYDNNNADSKRPGIDAFTLDNTPIYFKVKDGEWEKLTFANMTEAGLEAMPSLTVGNSGSNAYTLSVKDLPAEIKIFSEDGTTVLDTTTIKWSFSPNGEASKAKPRAMDGYEATVNDEGEWVYTYLTDIVFTVELDWGTLGERVNGVRKEAGNLVLENFVLNGEEGSTPVTLQSLKEQGKLDYVVTEGTSTDQPTTFTFTIKDQPMYSSDNSALINYNVDVKAENEDIKFELPRSLTDEDKDDYLVATYDNTHAVNHNSDTDAIYPDGTLNLRLTGETTFEATKVWLDWETWNEEEVHRPDLTFELWRYREDAMDGEIAPVKDASNKVITIELSSEESAKYEPEENIYLKIQGADDKLLPLDKYDSDGYRYIYFLKEIVNADADDNVYEQVFGRVGRDLGQGKVEITDDALPLKHAQIYQGQKERRSDDICLYNGGVLSNRLSGTRQVELTKKWNAAAYQGYMGDVSVEYTLQVQYLDSTEDEGKWYNAYPEVTRTQENITEENMAYWHTSATVPNVGPLGRDVAYRWAETAVYQNGEAVTSETDASGRVTRFTLKQNGQDVQYSVEYTDPEDNVGGDTIIENSIADTINYDVTKVWEDGTDPEEVTFNLYRLPSGSALTDSTPVYLQFTLDRNEAEILEPVPEDFKGNIGVETEKEGSVEAHDKNNPTDKWKDNWQETWRTVINDLPRYDAEGRAYEYVLLEDLQDNDRFPIYTTERDPDTGDYKTQVINPAPGEGNRIMVRKEWNDDSDSAHRGAVTINVYAKNPKDGDDATEPIKTVTLENDVWMQEVHIGEYTADEVYILETSVGGTNVPLQPYTFGGENGPDYETPEAPESTDVYQYQTEHHRYEATYSQTNVSGEDILIVNNRRLGNIDLTVTKTWNDGESQLRDALQKANEALGDKAIYPYLQLDFADGYTADGRVIREDTVTLTDGSPTEILNADGNKTTSLQQLHLDLQGDAATEKVYFFNLPKYDKSGAVASYSVKEVWIAGSGEPATQITGKAALKDYFEKNLPTDYEGKKELLNLLDEFSTSVKQDSYTSKDEAIAPDGTIPHDDQQMTVTNGLGNTKNVVWYKHWNDQYVYEQNHRPDIYIDVYRVVHDKDGKERVELVKQDYRWDPRTVSVTGEDDTVSDEIDPNSWRVTMYDVQKYDALGYEIQYYAIERTLIDYPSYDYVVGDYYKTNDLNFSEGNYLGTADEIKTGGESYVLNFAEMKDKFDKNIDPTKVLSPDYAANALKEGGMFVNSLDDQVAFQGQKIWQAESMPNGYDDINLPAVTFELYRTTKSADEVKDDNGKLDYSKMDKFATQTVTDWASAHQNGTYVFTFMEKNAEGNDTDKALKLPRYDAEGNVYTYYMREASADLGENGPALNEVFTVTDPESNTYVATNVYNPPEGELHVKKFLQLPADLGTEENDKFPTIQFTLTRTYTGTDKDGNENATIEDTSFKKAIEWDWQDVKQAYAAAKAEAAGESGDSITLTNDDLKFEKLEIYAPNGSKFVYTVTETSENFLYGYSTYAELGNLEFEKLSGGENKTTVSGLEPVVATESENPEATLDTQSDEPEKSWATFKNVSTQKTFIQLEGSKEWDDYDDQFGIRPSQDAFKEILTVTRTAKQQGNEGNQITETLIKNGESVEEGKYNIQFENDSWNYTITSTDPDEFEVYAPNGMPWTYKVTENLDALEDLKGIYKGDPSSVSIDATTIKGDTGELGALKNSTSTSVNFEKKWKDSDGNAITEDYLGRELSITFQLQVRETGDNEWTNADAYFKDKTLPEEVKFTKIIKSTLNPSATWSGSFTKLPLAIKDGEQIVRLQYRVVEISVDVTDDDKDPQTITITEDTNEDKALLYKVDGDGLVTNATLENVDGKWITTNTLDLDSLTITKVWNDGNNQFGTRPSPGGDTYSWTASFIVQRQEDGKWTTLQSRNNQDKVFTLYGNEKTDGDTDHTITISGLPEGEYRVVELQPGYKAEKGVIGEQYFVDNNGSYYNDTYKTEYEKDGLKFTVTNTLNTTGTSITVEKNWHPEGNVLENATIEATLQYKNGEDGAWTDLSSVTLNKDNEWKHTWTNLPKYYNDSKTTTQYQVVEGNVTGADDYMKLDVSSTKDGNGNVTYTITNVEKTSFDVEKKWVGMTPADDAKISIQLYRTTDKDAVGSTDATTVEQVGGAIEMTAAKEWKHSFTDLPAYDKDGNKYIYFAVETSTGNYLTSYDYNDADKTVITNTSKGEISGTKTWKDNGDAYKTRPETLTLTLTRSVAGGDSETVNATPEWTKNDDNTWTYVYKDLPMADKTGQAYTYTVEEALPEGSAYVCKADGLNLTNTLTGKVEVSGTKTWVGGQPAELQLTLSRSTDGETWEEVKDAEGQLLQPTWANTDTDKWTYTYSDLPKYDENGVLYRYKVAETVPQDYDSAATSGEAVAVEDGDENVYTYDFTNVKKGALTVEKIVQGNRGETDRAFEFTVTLTGESTTGVKAEEINDKYGDMTFENGKATFTLKHGESITANGLPAGLTYTVEETNANADGYTTSNSGNTGTIPSGDTAKVYFTNTKHEGEALTTSVSVQKVWKIDNGGEQPESVKVQLEKDGQPYGNPVTLSDKNGWKHEWKDLPLGFTWTVEEVDAPEGFTSYTNNYDNHFVITNDDVDTEQKPETVNVKKVWVIDDGGERPDSVSVQLMRDGEPFGDPVTLNDANDWSYAWNDLESGHNWTVVELNVPDGFKATVSQSGDTFTIINDDTTEETTEIRANKEWTIDDGGTRADSVTVQLYCDGQPWGDPVTLSDSNDWTTLWEELPVGHSWSVVEINVPAGFTSSVTQEDSVITITNDDIPTDIPDPERPDPDPDDPTDIPDPEKPDPDPDDPEPEDPDDPTDIPDPEKPDTDDPDDPTDIPDTEKPDDNKDPDNPTTPSNPSTPSSPSTPSHSTTPGTSGTTTTTTTDKSDDKDAPKTGDNTHTRALFVLCLASLAGMTVIGVSRKRQRKDDSDQS